ncbi:unnamed protein product [Mycena citricolor]|uniref:SEC7 domain-containing protein n=1 Tax=Mycena citricolor TaxID=2018698 RepID=A0AAD2HVK6_9AGAR|nr:unnamed protein product [Mycena citricolor]
MEAEPPPAAEVRTPTHNLPEESLPPSSFDQRDVRKNAVARLKRAASLPRMKDGRRPPPMHPEGVSEGEKVNTDDERQVDTDTPPPPPEDCTAENSAVAENGDTVGAAVKADAADIDADNEADGGDDPTAHLETSSRPKRRSRSRTRSRGSKDLKLKRAALSPAPSPLVPSDSSQDEGASSPLAPSLASPIPSNLAALQRSRLLRSPTPTSNTRPPTPNLPSLEDLQRGLFRSNSVGSTSVGRIMAMHKLTGGTETYEPSPAPATPPLPGKLGRNNTVSGGERSAVREFMLSRLGDRLAKGTDAEPVSEREEYSAPSPSPTPRKKRRRSRRGSTSANAGVSDSEFMSTSPNTPIVPSTPLPWEQLPEPVPPIAGPSRATSPRGLFSDREETSSPALNRDPSPALAPSSARDSPASHDRPRRRSVLVEDDDDRVPFRPGPPVVAALPRTPPVYSVPVSRQMTPEFPMRHSPFARPLEERVSREEDEEKVLYPGDSYDGYDDNFQREISWVADPLPEIMDDDVEEEDYGVPQPSSPESSSPPRELYDDSSPQNSVMIEPETSPEIAAAQVPPSPTSVAGLSQLMRSGSEDSTSYPQTVPLTTDLEWDDGKRWEASTSSSTWDKIKTTFSRSGSASGRRSRSNSIVTRDRRDHTDSSASRESGASLTKGELSPALMSPPIMMQASASASAVSLSASGSAFPAPSSADLLKYQNAKLFPFPGMKKLEEQQRSRKGNLTPSASSPDVALFSGYETEGTQNSIASYANTPLQSPEHRDRKLSHQLSDSRLLERYTSPYSSPPSSVTPSAPPQMEYFTLPPLSPSSSSVLPMTRAAVKQWLSRRQKSSQNKLSLTDLTKGKDWEDDLELPESKTVTAATSPVTTVTTPEPREPPPPVDITPKARMMASPPLFDENSQFYYNPRPAIPSPPDPLSATPDPGSSLSDYARGSTSESSSTNSSHYSDGGHVESQGSLILEKLEENLARSSRSPMWASVIDEPPRRFLMSSACLQVVNANTIKDRFLFLFSDILVITKPIMHENGSFVDAQKPMFADRRYIVKSIVQISQMRFNADRTDLQTKASNYSSTPRSQLIRGFISHFSTDMDQAVSALLSQANLHSDPTVLGHLMFKTVDLDRARLGEYLARRTSKLVLKAYLDSFHFVGVRVDRALRAFLLSLVLPEPPEPHSKAPGNSAFNYMIDAFSHRWYEANARIVVYDKDLANQLVHALLQLNVWMHGGLACEPGPTALPRRTMAPKDFINAFRQFDQRGLIADETLEAVFKSVREERLSQARIPHGVPDVPILLKRPLPGRLIYKVSSDPIVLRIPQADPDLVIHLYGQDLVFDPPRISFSRSGEASFRVTATSLGTKTMILCRGGPNALKYSGLPLSHPFLVERAFMRNTFEIAFLNHHGLKRRYMFSFDDPLIRHQWVVSLQRQLDSGSSISSSSLSQLSQSVPKFHRAAEIMALKALQQTLMGCDTTDANAPPPVRLSVQKLRPNGLSRLDANASFRFPPESRFVDHEQNPAQPGLHIRSKSRSKVYHKDGAGRNELELNDVGDAEVPDEHGEQDPTARVDGPLWTSHELVLQCAQNSSIVTVLSYLQVGAPENGFH